MAVARCAAGHAKTPFDRKWGGCQACEREKYEAQAAAREEREAALIARSIPDGDMIMRAHDGTVQRFRMPRLSARAQRIADRRRRR